MFPANEVQIFLLGLFYTVAIVTIVTMALHVLQFSRIANPQKLLGAIITFLIAIVIWLMGPVLALEFDLVNSSLNIQLLIAGMGIGTVGWMLVMVVTHPWYSSFKYSVVEKLLTTILTFIVGSLMIFTVSFLSLKSLLG